MMLTAFVIVLVLPILVEAEPDDDYNLIFRYSSRRLSAIQVEALLKSLFSYQTGLDFDDPRRTEVRFWLGAAYNDESKCNRVDYEMLETHLKQDTSIAETKRTEGFFGDIINLEIYAQYINVKRRAYCEKKFRRALSKSSFLKDVENSVALSDLTRDYIRSDTKDVEELGKRVAELLLQCYEETNLEFASQPVDNNIEPIRKYYERHTPCAVVLEFVEQSRRTYEYLTIPENYQSVKSPIVKNFLDKASVCLFIEEHEKVFEHAADIVYREIRMKGLYNPIFRFSSKQLSLSDIRIALIQLESYRTGLLADDPRRIEVSLWLGAARHDESNCNSQQDGILRSHFERAKAIADKDSKRGDVFNLEYYFIDVISDRLLYCQSKFGVPFINELAQQFKADDYNYLFELTRTYRRTDTINAHKLSERIGDLILRNSKRLNFDELIQSLNGQKVEELYKKHSPCTRLLNIAEKYEQYISLIVVPENYEHVRPSMRNWVDKISVCRYIDQSKQVFEYAFGYLRRIKQAKGPSKSTAFRKSTQFKRTPK